MISFGYLLNKKFNLVKMKTKFDIPFNREAWLNLAVIALKPIFSEKGYSIPPVRVSCGFPSSFRRGNIVGQCWGTSFSNDGVNEIFISPVFSDPFNVLDTLTHELVHAVDNCEHKHGEEFKKIALSVGLEGKMINASAGLILKERLQSISSYLISNYGKYPHAEMSFPKSESSSVRLNPQAICRICGFQVRVSSKYLKIGPPICPLDKVVMEKKGKWN